MPSPDDAWHITIADNGRGIADEDKTRIFERFERGGDGTRGLGLGLSLSAAIVERCGGSISVHDRVPGLRGNGCQFTIVLPQFHRPTPMKTDLRVIEKPGDERQAREG
jgi:signal transduction histidine kinase